MNILIIYVLDDYDDEGYDDVDDHVEGGDDDDDSDDDDDDLPPLVDATLQGV